MAGVPEYRTPIIPAFGLKADLLANLEALQENEFCWAVDEDRPYIVKVGLLGAKTLAPGSGGVRSVTALSGISVADPSGAPVLSLVPATTSTIGGMSAADKTKLDDIALGANNYVLPAATLSVLGGVKADGTSTQIDPDGTIHAVGAGGGGGSVTLVSGAAPITVTNGTTTPLIAIAAATTTAVGVVRLADAAAILAGTAGRVVDAAQLQAYGTVPQTRAITAGSGLTGGGDLSANRSLAVDFATSLEATTGTSTVKVMNPARVAEVVAGKVGTARTLAAGTGLSGGGDLSADRAFAVDFASQAEAQAATSLVKVLSPARGLQLLAAAVVDSLASTATDRPLSAAQGRALDLAKVPTARAITAGSGLTGGGDLSANRSLAVDFATSLEATTGTSTVKVMNPATTAAALAGRVATARVLTAGTGLTGGGDLSADRTFALTGQALALHNLASNGLLARTGAGTFAARAVAAGTGLTVSNGNGVAGDPTVAAVVATTGQAQAGTDNTSLMTPLRSAEAIAALAPLLTATVQTFTASGTFAKAADDVLYLVEAWAGGASGSKSGGTDPAGGGGGGGYGWTLVPATSVADGAVVTVGAGGAAVSALGGGNGNPGGFSAFADVLKVWGGLGGIATGNGGRGGGLLDPTGLIDTAAPQGGFLGGSTTQASVYGGGGGNSGASVFGGAGGGRSTGTGSEGGASSLAGDGGAGGTTFSGQDGQVPGGGGGATQDGAQSGAGGRGEVRITRLRRRA